MKSTWLKIEQAELIKALFVLDLKSISNVVQQQYEENQFADTDEMSAWAKESVKAIQMSGILSGKPDNKFDPKGIATRAEVSSMLRRLIELIEGI